MTASVSPEVIEKQKKLFCDWFKKKHSVDLFFDERGDLCIPPRSGHSVPLVAGVAWAAWQESRQSEVIDISSVLCCQYDAFKSAIESQGYRVEVKG